MKPEENEEYAHVPSTFFDSFAPDDGNAILLENYKCDFLFWSTLRFSLVLDVMSASAEGDARLCIVHENGLNLFLAIRFDFRAVEASIHYLGMHFVNGAILFPA